MPLKRTSTQGQRVRGHTRRPAVGGALCHASSGVRARPVLALQVAGETQGRPRTRPSGQDVRETILRGETEKGNEKV